MKKEQYNERAVRKHVRIIGRGVFYEKNKESYRKHENDSSIFEGNPVSVRAVCDFCHDSDSIERTNSPDHSIYRGLGDWWE